MTVGRPLSVVQLVAYKVLQRGREVVDRRGGLARAQRFATEQARASLGSCWPLARWLTRPGAGRIWLDPGLARRWASASCSEADLAWAEDIVSGRFTLLGADRTPLGNPPPWHRDLYTGRDWPLQWAGRLPVARGDGGDIRTGWGLSRCYHFAVLAKAYWHTGESRFLATFRGHVESWLEAN